jgi:hypothetical protein
MTPPDCNRFLASYGSRSQLLTYSGRLKLLVDRFDRLVERIDLPDERSEGEAHAVRNHELAVLIDAAVGQLATLRARSW